VSSAIHLRFDVPASSLADAIKVRLLALPDSRVTAEGVFVLKAQTYRTQEQNRQDAFSRLQAWVNSVAVPQKPRLATKPSYASKQRRLESKSQRSSTKQLRAKPLD
jgi:ribosome-associated protein